MFAYFIPSDRQPIPDYAERIDVIMRRVQDFYRQSMISNGYGPLTFTLDHDASGKLKFFEVHGKNPELTYGNKSSGLVRDEVKAALKAQGINTDSRVLAIFQILRDGSYVGSGNNVSGTLWVKDDEKLDPRKFDFAVSRCGGIAHELGHALGCPHVAGPKSNPQRSLMANGNYTFGDELIGKGPGTYLHPASAMLLAHCRSFVGDLPDAKARPNVLFTKLRGQYATNTLVLDGRLICTPPAFGIIAYNDNQAIPGNYDATGWISRVDAYGNFQLRIGEIKSGDYQLRLQVVCYSGATRTFPIDYHVNEDGLPDLNKLTMSNSGGGKNSAPAPVVSETTSERDVQAELSKLKQLFDQGVISKKDYDQKRKAILDSL